MAEARDEDARLALQPGEGVADEVRPLDAAVEDLLLEGFGPAAAGDVLAGEVDDGVDAFELRAVDLAAVGVPVKLAGFVLHRAANGGD